MPSAVIVALIIAEMKRQIGKLIATIGLFMVPRPPAHSACRFLNRKFLRTATHAAAVSQVDVNGTDLSSVIRATCGRTTLQPEADREPQ
jgi:hypothetical protein